MDGSQPRSTKTSASPLVYLLTPAGGGDSVIKPVCFEGVGVCRLKVVLDGFVFVAWWASPA